MTPNQQVLSDEQVSAAWTVGTDGDAYIDPLLMRFARAIESATLAALAQQAQPVHQFRRRLCAEWYDGHPDHEDGGGPYETRILYTAQQAQPVDERDELEADMADKAAVMPAAVVAEVYQSRYTIEWVNGPMPLGTNLYAGPKVVKAWAEEVRKLRAERDALAALQSPAPQTKGQP